MTHREKLWQHFIASGNPMAYVAYRAQAKKDNIQPHSFENHTAHHSHMPTTPHMPPTA